MKRGMLFNSVKSESPKRNRFDLTHEKKLSGSFGKLIPILCEECIPSDKFTISNEMIVRFHPTLAPIMHRIDAYIHYFFVPYRLVWDNFADFITGGEDGTAEPAFPNISLNNTNVIPYTKSGSLCDYLGIQPVGTEPLLNNVSLNALPFRAYQLIYNEWYRDENLQPKVEFSKGDVVSSGDTDRLCQLATRNWAKDYFTSAMTSTQKGGEVLIPITGEVTYKDVTTVHNSNGSMAGDGPLETVAGGLIVNDATPANARVENIDTIENATATINDLRKAYRLQKWLERNARSGSRLAEFILAHFSVKTDDLRIGRPAYLGGSKYPVSVSEVLSTTKIADEQSLGEMAGHMISVGGSNGCKYFVKEHGLIMGIMSVMPKADYMTGIPRMFYKTNKFDFPFPEFAQLGEEPVYNFELFFNWYRGVVGENIETWGYQSRYASYKFRQNSVHGDFRTNLSYWHMGRDFSARPELTGDFIKGDMASLEDRIFPIQDSQDTHKIYVSLLNKIQAIRPLPIYGTPAW